MKFYRFIRFSLEFRFFLSSHSIQISNTDIERLGIVLKLGIITVGFLHPLVVQ